MFFDEYASTLKAFLSGIILRLVLSSIQWKLVQNLLVKLIRRIFIFLVFLVFVSLLVLACRAESQRSSKATLLDKEPTTGWTRVAPDLRSCLYSPREGASAIFDGDGTLSYQAPIPREAQVTLQKWTSFDDS